MTNENDIKQELELAKLQEKEEGVRETLCQKRIGRGEGGGPPCLFGGGREGEGGRKSSFVSTGGTMEWQLAWLALCSGDAEGGEEGRERKGLYTSFFSCKREGLIDIAREREREREKHCTYMEAEAAVVWCMFYRSLPRQGRGEGGKCTL